MSMPVRIDPALYERAKIEAAIEHRTIAGQIEFWAQVGRASIENPDLPVTFIIELLAAVNEPSTEKTAFLRRNP